MDQCTSHCTLVKVHTTYMGQPIMYKGEYYELSYNHS